MNFHLTALAYCSPVKIRTGIEYIRPSGTPSPSVAMATDGPKDLRVVGQSVGRTPHQEDKTKNEGVVNDFLLL